MTQEAKFTADKRREMNLAALEEGLVSGRIGDDGLGLYIDVRRRQYLQQMAEELKDYWNDQYD